MASSRSSVGSKTARSASRPATPATLAGLTAPRPGHDPVAQYLDEIARYARLTRDEEVALSQLALAGDTEAQDRLVTANLRLVVSICKDFTRNHFALLDLVSIGNEGLIIASRKFNGLRGVPFANYAAYWIKQRVMKYVAEHGFAVRMPPYRAAVVNKVLRINGRLTQLLGRPATAAEVAAGTDLLEPEVDEVLRMLQPALELDAPLAEGEDTTTFGSYFGETVQDSDARLDQRLRLLDLQKAITRALATLPARDAQVLAWHFGLQDNRALDLDHIALKLGVSRERARQIKADALEKLKAHTDLLAFMDE